MTDDKEITEEVNNEKYKPYYERLESTGNNIWVLMLLISVISMVGGIISFLSAQIDALIIAIITTIIIIIFGSAISNLFTCIAEMARNTEKQTELLEKLNEKIDK